MVQKRSIKLIENMEREIAWMIKHGQDAAKEKEKTMHYPDFGHQFFNQGKRMERVIEEYKAAIKLTKGEVPEMLEALQAAETEIENMLEDFCHDEGPEADSSAQATLTLIRAAIAKAKGA